MKCLTKLTSIAHCVDGPLFRRFALPLRPLLAALCISLNMSSNEQFKIALSKFSDSVIAQQLQGVFDSPFPKIWLQAPTDDSLNTQERLNLLKDELKNWVILKCRELDEFEGEELERIWGEAVGCMFAIRELEKYFD